MKTQRQKREHEVLKYQEQLKDEAMRSKRLKKTHQEMEREARDEGLATKLDSSNKGFALLAKMGYKPGMRLGKRSSDWLIYIILISDWLMCLILISDWLTR